MEQDLEELLWLPVIRLNQYVIVVNELLSFATWKEEDSKKLWTVKDKLFGIVLARLDSVGSLHFIASHFPSNSTLSNGTTGSGGSLQSHSTTSSSIMQYINFKYDYSDDIVDSLCKIHEVEKQRIHSKLSGFFSFF